MKILKFSPPLPEMILSGEKTTTWRLYDDKDIKEGDLLSLIARPEMNEFAQAEAIEVKESKLGDLSYNDYDGHEKFESEEEMYSTYSKYYKIEVNSETPLKIIKFKLI